MERATAAASAGEEFSPPTLEPADISVRRTHRAGYHSEVRERASCESAGEYSDHCNQVAIEVPTASRSPDRWPGASRKRAQTCRLPAPTTLLATQLPIGLPCLSFKFQVLCSGTFLSRELVQTPTHILSMICLYRPHCLDTPGRRAHRTSGQWKGASTDAPDLVLHLWNSAKTKVRPRRRASPRIAVQREI